MRHITRKPAFSICENKATEQLCSNHTADQRLLRYIEQFLYFLNSNSQVSSHLLWLYSPVCVGPGQKPLYWFSHYDAHLKAFWFLFQTAVLSPLLKRKPETKKKLNWVSSLGTNLSFHLLRLYRKNISCSCHHWHDLCKLLKFSFINDRLFYNA